MPLINFTKEELYKIMECINGDADSYGDTVCESILEKIENKIYQAQENQALKLLTGLN